MQQVGLRPFTYTWSAQEHETPGTDHFCWAVITVAARALKPSGAIAILRRSHIPGIGEQKRPGSD
jgi:hypothetical protein